jgi:predicted DNA-binding WGR domain protein
MAPTDTRFFEFQEGSSDKFWTITLNGLRHTVRFGRKGTNGQQQLKEFDSAEGARSSFDKLIAEKLKKGYRETQGQETPGQSKIAAAWWRIESWLEENAPASRASLQPPASAEQIADIEKQLSLRLPDDLKESLQAHNGS